MGFSVVCVTKIYCIIWVFYFFLIKNWEFLRLHANEFELNPTKRSEMVILFWVFFFADYCYELFIVLIVVIKNGIFVMFLVKWIFFFTSSLKRHTLLRFCLLEAFISSFKPVDKWVSFYINGLSTRILLKNGERFYMIFTFLTLISQSLTLQVVKIYALEVIIRYLDCIKFYELI